MQGVWELFLQPVAECDFQFKEHIEEIKETMNDEIINYIKFYKEDICLLFATN